SRLWGGQSLAPYLGLASAPDRLAEVWLVYEENRVDGGPFSGEMLRKVAEREGEALLGRRPVANAAARGRPPEFPLLAKLIDAADHLSVQVHPDDAYAREREAASGFQGKNEAWYLLRAGAGAELVHGFSRDTAREEVRRAALDGSLLELVRRIPARAGDTVLVEAGTVHAINAGVMLFEIQQKSDLTYRLYDYGRKDAAGRPRELHVDRALDVLRYAAAPPRESSAPRALGPGRELLVSCAHFAMEKLMGARAHALQTSPETFEILAAVEGSADLSWEGGETWLKQGEAVVLPASLGAYRLAPQGAATVLRCWVP
ncbi:MAG TPA: type I phosphomannose isomerase catalytic subunit, partial [Myxococcales bacterium]|nr:type I phosphomannose isomerase catalytic subunit [Myxococcales bacterium]